jgi:hypothetical protein
MRIGNEHDGGYIINDLIVKNTKRLISVGIGGEDNFELQWAEKFPTTSIEAYDGTYPCNNLCNKFPDRINKNIFYVHNDVGFGEKQIPLNTIVDSKEGVLLKVDIEGGEYTAFDNLYPDRNLTGLILEVHDLHIPENCQKIAKIITENFKNLLLFHGDTLQLLYFLYPRIYFLNTILQTHSLILSKLKLKKIKVGIYQFFS